MAAICLLLVTDQSSDLPKKLAVREQVGDAIDDFYRHQTESTTLADALWVLALSFTGRQGDSAVNEFIKAYVHGGTVVNPLRAKRRLDEDIHSEHFLENNRSSHRSATMPRDYIFAIMPPFPWYTYPEKDALSMSFGEIYLDLYQQAAQSGHAFACRITHSMLDPACKDPTNGWLPSQHLPSPTTLGDFLKLVGQRVPEASNAFSRHVHITSGVHIEEVGSEISPDVLISRLETCPKHFRVQWMESHNGGELSKFGNYPNHRWTLKYADAMSCGWLPTDPKYAIRVSGDGDHLRTSISRGLEFEQSDSVVDIANLAEIEQDARMDEASEYVSLFVQARKILDRMWCAHVAHRTSGERSEWINFKQRMQGLWSSPLLHAMLLLAGMVNCRIPLSAAAWVNKLFVPMYIHHSEALLSVGLLAKHARRQKHQRRYSRFVLCVGQHLSSPDKEAFGMDLFLVDPKSKVPVGLAPDMIPAGCEDWEFARITRSLYNGFCRDLGYHEVAIAARPLSTLNSRDDRGVSSQ